jgi:heme-degrading monooxygenase HmoA
VTPPYWAVIFTSRRTAVDQGYAETAQQMEALAAQQPGYLGLEHAGDASGAITVSYWQTEHDLLAWKQVVEHQRAQRRGRAEWYREYEVRVCKVERAYGFKK